ncbi:HAD-like domain-containing protein [Dichotomocladium elegans]|nr:HAD-like domain-containing protein [Dichotomocladium elegans]
MTPAIKALLIDLSGTIHIDATAIPGAVEAVCKLRASRIPFRFATNTTKVSSRRLVEKLNGMGFDIQENEAGNREPLLFMEDAALDEFEGLDTNNPNAVVIGLAPSKFRYDRMNDAFRLLMQDPKVPLIAVHKAKYFADKDEKLSMGPGGFVEGKKAQVVGKPTKSFFQLALKQIGMELQPEHVAMIGDDVNNDLGGGAQELGLQRFLVQTGKYRAGDEDGHCGVRVFPSVVQVIEFILEQQQLSTPTL